MDVTIIGIDCAVDPRKVGLALGIWRNQVAAILEVKIGNQEQPLAETIAGWIFDEIPTLVAVDAPLGWPADLGHSLAQHLAGGRLSPDANSLFRRKTDQVVKKELGRQPLDVGADRIARTAYAALRLLDELRALTDRTIPLAWDSKVEGVSVIEVYPAGTLTAYGIRASGYKKKGQVGDRREIIEKLRSHLELPEDTSPLEMNADVLDAGICVLAAADFLRDRVVHPADMVAAKKEGWIWFSAGRDINR